MNPSATESDSNMPSAPGGAQSANDEAKLEATELLNILGRHGRWWWLLLFRAKAWNFLLPWPLGSVVSFLRRDKARPKQSGWLSLSVPVAWYAIREFTTASPMFDDKLAAEAAKILFSGVFLLGTILSVSVAMPGQAIIKSILRKSPSWSIEFVAPFMWSLMWGIVGASLLFFLPRLATAHPWLVPVAISTGVYAAFMELHTISHTIRMYTIGLVVMSLDLIKEEESKAAKAQEDKQREEIEKLRAAELLSGEALPQNRALPQNPHARVRSASKPASNMHVVGDVT